MEPTTDSSVVIPIPIPSDTTTGNEEPLETTSADMEVSPCCDSLAYLLRTIVIIGKEATMPTLVTLAASLPRFKHPFAMTSVPKSPFETGVASDEEALDKARSCLMEGMHLLNEVFVRTKTLHEQTKEEAKRVKEEVVSLSERNQSLVKDFSQALGQQEELNKLNQDLQLNLDDAVSQLEIVCSSKDVSIKLLEEELAATKLLMFEKDARIATLSDSQLLMEENIASYQTGADQKAEELRWVIKEGIPTFVRAFLDSSDFGAVNAALQTFAIQLGLHKACVDMKEKYTEELKGKNVLYSYLDAHHQIMERFSEMTTYKYSLVSALESEEMDVGGLKKLLKTVDSSGADEVGSG
ncbi:unnamed protein product [Lactuca virosa]|uniref:FRIGIDA-like protein n=1 Tax=Lactuca virosa TaxID=75947 RepID=A0AAU9NK10_9ASTR|nr:unnamed protein product [Lactuca virosa]